MRHFYVDNGVYFCGGVHWIGFEEEDLTLFQLEFVYGRAEYFSNFFYILLFGKIKYF